MPDRIPMMGLGTFGRLGEEGTRAILTALEAGYRHLDAAQSYGSESMVGEALRQSGLPREDVFITTKVAQGKLDRAQFLPSVEESLRTMGLEQIDLVLVHWPSPGDAVPFESYIEDLARVQEQGKARLIGVSNFTIDRLKRAEEILGPGRIHTDQVEIQPWLQNRKLVDYCLGRDITPTAYVPLAKGKVADDPTLRGIADAHGCEASQVALAWLMQRGIAIIPASSNPDRMRSNFAAQDVKLSEEDMAKIADLDSEERIIDPDDGPDWD